MPRNENEPAGAHTLDQGSRQSQDQGQDGARDSVAAELPTWIAQMTGADPGTEAARQRVGRIARLLEQVLARAAREHGLTVGDWAALSVLRRSGPPHQCTPKELASQLDVTSGTMSVRIDRLTQAGLVEPADATDGRSRPVRLTDRGQRYWSAATEDRTAQEQHLFAGTFTAGEVEQLNVLLARLLGRLEGEFGPAPRHDTPRRT